jgi:hypothetical protein
MTTLRSVFRSILLLSVLAVIGLSDAYGATVTGTFTTTGSSSSVFVRAGEKVRFQLSGTFSATVNLEESNNGGLSWSLVDSFTSTVATELAPRTNDTNYRLTAFSYTSGTVTYSLTNVLYAAGRFRFTTVPTGSVAYGAFGSPLVPPVAGTLYVSDVMVTRNMTVTGIAILNGATCGTDKYVLWLFDSSGKAIGKTSLDGTTCSGTDAFQAIALTSTVQITPGQYFIGAKVNGTTDRTRFIAGNTFVDPITSATAHSNARVGSFGSDIFSIDVPTSFTAGQGPIAYLYGY